MNRTALFLSILVVGLACGEASEVMDEMIDTPDAGAMEPPGSGGSATGTGGDTGSGGSSTPVPRTLITANCNRTAAAVIGESTFETFFAEIPLDEDYRGQALHAVQCGRTALGPSGAFECPANADSCSGFPRDGGLDCMATFYELSATRILVACGSQNSFQGRVLQSTRYATVHVTLP